MVAALARRAPPGRAAEWDPVGLQLGDPAAPAKLVGLCHEVTAEVVAAVEADRVDLLVAYHPLLFRPTRSLVAGPGAEGRAWRLARRDVALAVVHTGFDVAPGGAADALAAALELLEPRGFAPLFGAESLKVITFLPADDAERVLDAVVAAGAGRIGDYTHCSWRTGGLGTFHAGAETDPAVGRAGEMNRESEVRLEFVAPVACEAAVVAALCAAHPYEEPAYDVIRRRPEAGMLGRIGAVEPGTTLGELCERVVATLGAGALRVAGDPGRELEQVAVLPGSGADHLPGAAQAGADAVVTGDVGHHAARDATDRGLAVIDAGHAPTERPGLRALLAGLAADGIAVKNLLDLDADPWEKRPRKIS